MLLKKTMLLLTVIILTMCISACSAADNPEECSCKANMCMQNGICMKDCKCPDMKDGMCPDDCMCMTDMIDEDKGNNSLIPEIPERRCIRCKRLTFQSENK